MSNSSQDAAPPASREEIISALFANMISQQTNMAFMFLGRIPHPDTGEVVQDFETSKFFIDQLEMLAVKTKGNLDRQEEALLNQSLTALRLAFVEAVDGGPAADSKPAPAIATGTAPAAPEARSSPEKSASTEAPAAAKAPAPVEEESRKKFTKKY